jgi:hypothetical protein
MGKTMQPMTKHTLISRVAAAAVTVSFVAALGSASAASAAVINISGTQNGEQSGGSDCNVACEGALIDPVQVTLGPGTYVITDAYSPATGLEAGALYDAWNFEAGNDDAWVWHWKALTDDGSDGSTINQGNYASHLLLDIDSANPVDNFTSEAAAAAFGAATPSSTFTLTAPTTVDFVVNDDYLPDNAGGVSLNIEAVSAAPEPSSWTLMIAGTGLVGAMLRRRRRGQGVLALNERSDFPRSMLQI